jgi:hypothetical protein
MSENKSLFLTDSPNVEQDSFQVHSNIANTLYDIITKHNVSENSFTIGLFGEWGSGKSFIINKLYNKIKEETSDVTFINIDVWKYSGQPLLRSILFELNKQFKSFYKNNKEKYEPFKNGYKNKKDKSLQDILYYDEVFESESRLSAEEFKIALKSLLNKYKIPLILLGLLLIGFIIFQFVPNEIVQDNAYLKILKPLLNGIAVFSTFIGAIGIFIGILQKPLKDIGNLIFFRNTVKNFTEKANFSTEQFEGIFKDFLSKIENEKYIIVFDNIDRCEPNIAYETLSTIKTFMDVKNCFYIIPADDDAIKSYLSNSKEVNSFERKFTEEFIDKIFQTYIRIPTLKEVERDRYIKEQLMKIDFQRELSDDDIETITQILYFAYRGESPRNIIRFINDYSLYFHFALQSLPKLLDNLTLFTIMIAIKQKWYHFEKILLENPDFFNEYPNNKNLLKGLEHDNINELENFLDNIQSYYIPKIKNNPIDEYLFFKESEKSLEIADALKNNQPEKIELNDENIKILIREFRKLVTVKGQFSINSFIVFAKLISENKTPKFTNKLVTEFWLCFLKTPKEELKSILHKLLDDNLLTSITNTINSEKLKGHRTIIAKTFIEYFKEPIESNSKFEEYVKVFSSLLDSKYDFKPDLIKELFVQWKKENQYLNSLLKIISTKKKTEYLPNNILQQLIDSPIDTASLAILKNWDNRTIPLNLGSKLLNVVLNRIKQRNFANYQQLAQHKPNIEQDYELILLLDTSFVEASPKDDFINSLSNLTSRVFQFANNQPPLFELGVKLWIEITYFSSINNSLIDDKLLQIFNQFIKPNPTILNLMLENIKYPEDILSLPKTKQAIFNTSSDIQRKLYNELEINDSFTDFDLIISYPITQSHIDILLQFITNNKIDIDKSKLSEYLLERVIYELVTDKADITEKLTYLKSKFDLEKHKKIILDYKNGIVDFSKEHPQNAYNILSEVKSILSYSEFFNNILKRIFSYIKAELEQGEDITEYNQISLLLESTKNKQDNELLYSISKQCLEKNQSIEENYFGIDILKTIFPNLTNDDKKEIKTLIMENDHFDEWNNDNIEKLIMLGIINRKKDNDEN